MCILNNVQHFKTKSKSTKLKMVHVTKENKLGGGGRHFQQKKKYYQNANLDLWSQGN